MLVLSLIKDRIKRLFVPPKEPPEKIWIAPPYISPPRGRRKRAIPETIEAYYIPTYILARTQEYIVAHGKRDEECYLFWGGAVANEGECYVTSCIYPKVKPRGGGVKVSRQKMDEITDAIRKFDQIIVAQVHSHPGDFGHSSVDEQRAVSYHKGFISIVVPSFGDIPVYELRKCYVYEYHGQGQWRRLKADEIFQRFIIEESNFEV